ncbi:UDP-phosphate galactose phosphotransferase [Burkholderia sp. AU33803]|nr:UDP-phosphate galactose phosphotransferase [Burkholderia sp. AU33803]PRD92561.1 UDP-phosphate galactose phosphotransferase [Burkholderia contaminans]
MIVSGAIAPTVVGIEGEIAPLAGGMPIAFATAFSLSVFPACGLYVTRARDSVGSILSRTILAWGAVQSCCAALLFAIDGNLLASATWFLCWTMTTCIGLLAFRAVLPTLFGFRGAAWPADAAPGAIRSGAERVAQSRLKRALDVTLALGLIAVFSPLLALIAVAVKLDGGACLYAQTRVGRGGRPFRCLKFRTMEPDADRRLQTLLESNPQARAEWQREFKLKDDVRITPMGRILRRTSLDELPQLFNVVRADMSLVGPRPIVEAELPRYGADLAYYLAVRPGMTGLWQVSGRNDTSYATRVSLDVRYVRTWSLGQDLRILLKTIGVVVRGAGAY